MKNFSKILFASIFLLIGFSTASFALTPLDNINTTILNQFQGAAGGWQPYIQARAEWLFWVLAVMNLVWMGIQLALKSGDLYDFVYSLVKQVLLIGFFYALLINGNVWMRAIINSFVQIGGNVPGGSAGSTPAAVLEQCWNVYMRGMGNLSLTSVHTWAMGLVSIIFLAIGVFMSAVMLITIIEAYLGLVVGQIFLGFGASAWTRDYAISYVKYIVSLGFRLMVINLVSALSVGLFSVWVNIPPAQFGMEELSAITVGLGILCMLLVMVPGMINNLLSGGQFAPNTFGVIGSAVATGVGIATAGAGLAAGAATNTAKSMAVLTEATKSAKAGGGGVSGAIKAAYSAGTRTIADNMGKPKPFRTPIMGGIYANMRASRQEQESNLNNLSKGDS
ncbi:MAG: P-type conjugative transfer protein TrbL [Proteobacteria bacterium]|nr:P-type conjugative transfer protein TrbL [Pseudomonadota bacterium]MBU1541474.1 P-type conjugative transfer protein TrbL [Pseudomonadota bacterium]MBU2431857.1 P-type conjugative transfer protein TrbL [Pseudomonadota bacterium]MBU2480310.1 P-type conjugative transfer protein TrbL [Pseudomonadota bacterium]